MAGAAGSGALHRGRRRRGRSGGINPPLTIDGRIWYSTISGRSNPSLLNSATDLSGSIFPHLIDQHGITSVQWYKGTNAASIEASLVSHVGSGSDPNWERTTTAVPHDLKGGTPIAANPFDLSVYTGGSSVTVGAYITKTDLSVQTAIATFAVGGSNVFERIAHGAGRFAIASTIQGADYRDFPKPQRPGNLDPEFPANSVNGITSLCNTATTAGKTNVACTIPLAWIQQNWNYNSRPTESLAALTAVANDATIYNNGQNRNATYLYTQLALACVNNGYPNAIFRLGHEHNGGWFPWSSAGGRALTYRAAFEVAAAAIRAAAPNIVIDFNIAHAGADPGGGSGEGQWTLDEDSIPDADAYDCVGLDLYCRSTGRSLATVTEEMDYHSALAASLDKPVSYPEIGVALPDLDPASTRYTGSRTTPQATDSQAAAFIDYVSDRANTEDLAYFSWFLGTGKKNQFYTYRPANTGRIDLAGTIGPWHPLSWAAMGNVY